MNNSDLPLCGNSSQLFLWAPEPERIASQCRGFQLLALIRAIETLPTIHLWNLWWKLPIRFVNYVSIFLVWIFQDKMYFFFRLTRYDVTMSSSRGTWWNGNCSGVRNAIQRHSIQIWAHERQSFANGMPVIFTQGQGHLGILDINCDPFLPSEYVIATENPLLHLSR